MSPPIGRGVFSDEPLDDVPLDHAPLVRVLAQVRFPLLVSMRPEAITHSIDRMVAELSPDYPIYEQSQEVQFSFGPEGFAQAPAGQLWELKNAQTDWVVSLGATSVAMYTTAYRNIGDFTERLAALLDVVNRIIAPPFLERVGIRYTNRVEDQDLLNQLDSLVRPEIVGGGALPLTSDSSLQHTLSESLYRVDAGMLHARWGVLPAGAVVDPSLPPSGARSWFLDLDSFAQLSVPFIPYEIGTRVRDLGHTAYQFFRWAVNETFLDEHGARR